MKRLLCWPCSNGLCRRVTCRIGSCQCECRGKAQQGDLFGGAAA